MDDATGHRSPWRFVPTLYFLQGIPVVVVQTVSVTLYKNLGVPNDQIGLWTSLIAWPWIAKMLWGPLVESSATRRDWVVWTQTLLIAALGLVALGVPQPAFLALTLGLFFGVAFLSATHDVAADGFYLLALKQQEQAFFVGIRSTAFRLAMIFGGGFLVAYAGKLHDEQGMAYPQAWRSVLLLAAVVYAAFFAYNLWAMPRPALDVRQRSPAVGELLLRFAQMAVLLAGLFLVGRWIVLITSWLNAALTGVGAPMVFAPTQDLTPLFLPAFVEHAANAKPYPFLTPNLVLSLPIQALISVALIVGAVASTRQMFRKIGMGPSARSYFNQNKIVAILGFVLFYRFGEVMIGKMSSPFLLDPVEKGGLAVGNQAVGVLVGTIGVLGLLLGGIAGGALIAKKGIKKCLWPMVLALNVPNLLYVWLAFGQPKSPLAEKIAKDAFAFMHIDVSKWSIFATSPQPVGTPESSAGGLLLPLVDFLVNIPSQLYNLFLLMFEAIKDPVGQVVLVDQFGYGFGFSAYMVFLMFISQTTKDKQTSHYAISTGLMALGAMFAGIVSGYVQQYFGNNYGAMGYAYFFIAVLVCTIPGMITLLFIPKDGEDIRQATVELD